MSDHTKDGCPGCGGSHDPSKPFTVLGPDVPKDCGPKLKVWQDQIAPLLQRVIEIAEANEITFFAHARCDALDDARCTGATTVLAMPNDVGFVTALHVVARGTHLPVPREAVLGGDAIVKMLSGHDDDDDDDDTASLRRLLN